MQRRFDLNSDDITRAICQLLQREERAAVSPKDVSFHVKRDDRSGVYIITASATALPAAADSATHFHDR